MGAGDLKIESAQRNLFPEPIASKIDDIILNSNPISVVKDQEALYTIENFYSFGFDQTGICERLPKKTIFMEAVFAIGFLSAAKASGDYAVCLSASALMTSLFVIDSINYRKDKNKHISLTDDGKRRIFIRQVRADINKRRL